MFANKLLQLFFLIFHFFVSRGQQCGYDSCPKTKSDMINVHLVPHTHDDVGWLKTVDQYYYGSRKSITEVGVQYILDSVIPVLSNDPSKRFIYVEIAFFWRWWRQQDDRMRHQVARLVQNGQFEFINGGWSMNDEAATHYNDIIDQMTWGLRRLNDTFGECGRPRVAWQIDPFGHSREQANIFAQMGFDGLFFGRLDYADKDKRLDSKTMEMVWQGSDSLGKSSALFTGALYNGYGPPEGFCFDIFCGDDPIMDDPRLADYNLDRKVADFISAVKDQAQHYATNHIIMTMGSDFHYSSAISWYKNLDKLIKGVNGQQGKTGSKINLLYSTPSCYLKSLNEANQTWTTKADDFFPYASDPHAYWTGYFTSRPALKRMVRYGNNLLQVCKQLGALTSLDWVPGPEGDVTVMREAMGVAQHHDAVSGTAKQHVTFDYAQRLYKGFRECEQVISYAYRYLSGVTESDLPDQTFCHLLNVTQCDVTESSNTFVVTVYNPLARPVDKFVRLPVQSLAGYRVQDHEGHLVPVQVVPIPRAVQSLPGRQSRAKYEIVFKAGNLPPVGFRSYHVSKDATLGSQQMSHSQNFNSNGGKTFVQSEKMSLVYDAKKRLTHVVTPTKIYDVTQDFGWYEGHRGDNREFSRRASGAYIFRPQQQKPTLFPPSGVNATIFKGPIVTEIHQEISDYVSQVSRLYSGSQEVENEWIVGPIPVDDGKGKEVIVQYSTSLNSEGKFYTDSNGRQLLMRQRNFRPTWKLSVTEPVSGNYYPINSRLMLKDVDSGDQLTILNDRSQGGTSIIDGQLELMVHRRLLDDDAFGVDEALNETAFGVGLAVRGKHWLRISTREDGARNDRLSAEEKLLEPLLSFVPTTLSLAEWRSKYAMETSAVSELPANVHLLTLEEWKGNSRDSVLLRLEHQFEKDEDATLSKDVSVDLSKLFKAFDITSAEEVTLGANLSLNKLKRLQWKTESNHLHQVDGLESGNDLDGSLTVKLSPMQIRTFVLEIAPKKTSVHFRHS